MNFPRDPQLTLASLLALSVALSAAPPPLKVSDNHHFLVTECGTPFFWIGDTAWEIVHRLTCEEVDRYLQNRADKGFTVIQLLRIPARRWIGCWCWTMWQRTSPRLEHANESR